MSFRNMKDMGFLLILMHDLSAISRPGHNV